MEIFIIEELYLLLSKYLQNKYANFYNTLGKRKSLKEVKMYKEHKYIFQHNFYIYI